MTLPQYAPESTPRARARSILQTLLGDDAHDIDERLAAGEALTALLDPLPPGLAWTPLHDHPGTLADARHLLDTAAALETTTRGTLAVSLALHHLHRLTPGTP